MNVAKVSSDKTRLTIYCPGCREIHGVWIKHDTNPTANWQWNGNLEKPTLSPSILVTGTRPITDDERDRIMAGEHIEKEPRVCHSFVRDGNIEFLNDCTHELRGKTVPLEFDSLLE